MHRARDAVMAGSEGQDEIAQGCSRGGADLAGWEVERGRFWKISDNLCRIHPPGTPAGGTKYNTGQKRFLYRSRMMSVRGESGLVGKLVKKPVDQD